MKKFQLDHCAVVLLAAGKSDRLGTPKQMLVYRGKTLLRRSVEAAMGTGLEPVFVVLGASHSTMEKVLEDLKSVRIVNNKGWEEGMASSIRCGVEAAMRMEKVPDGLIIMVCDQPHVNTELLQSLVLTQQKTGMPVVASNYRDNPGVPALFHKSFFNRLLLLEGDTGARKLLKEEAEFVSLVDFPLGEADIDTMKDFNELKEKGEKRDDER